MKIAIMGTGGVGGYYGGLLARSGEDVTLIARGPHLAAIREKGLQVKSVHGDFAVSDIHATDSPEEIGPVDLILFTTKTHQTGEAVQAIKPIVSPETAILPLQNGVDAANLIGSVVGKEHMIGGVTYVSAAIEAPGVIGQYSDFRRIVLGEFDGTVTDRIRSIQQVLARTGVAVEAVTNINEILWTKFIFITSVGVMGALTRVAVGEYRAVPEARQILIDVMNETAAVGRAKGVNLSPDIVEKTLALVDKSGPDIKPSFQRDVEAGRKSEIESLIGTVVRSGVELGIPTPVMRFAYGVLKPGELKAQAKTA